MKVRVSGMVWMPKLDLGAAGIIQVKKELTITPRKPAYGNENDGPPTPIHCWTETPEEIGVPRAYFFGSVQRSHDITWDLADGRQTKLTSLLRHEGPYAEQAEAIDAIVTRFRSFDGSQGTGGALTGILRGTTGFGKTNTGLAIAHRMQTSTLVVVHKEFLFTQWQKRIARFIPDAKVGICRGPKCEYEGCDFVIAMAQSLAREEEGAPERYPEEFYRHFGLLIVDEVHRVGAPTWSPIPTLFPARYRLGLTATPRRKDGADKVFWWHLGEIVFTARTETPKPHVRVLNAETRGSRIMHQQHAPRGLVMKLLSQNTLRNHTVVNELVAAMRSPAGRKVLVLSHFLDHLRELESMFRERMIQEGTTDVTTSFYVGEWFSDEMSFSLAKRKAPLPVEDRLKAIDALFRHFRRNFFDVEKTWRCGLAIDDKRYVALYKHGFRPVCLDDVADKGLIAMAKDYGVSQDKAKEKKKTLTENELHEAERARVIFATYQMCSEGVDIPAVDTLVFATPMSDVEQAYGRGRRNCVPRAHGGEMDPEQCRHLCAWRAENCKGKPHPVAADLADPRVPISARAKRHRLDFYKSIGAKVVESAA